MLRAVAERLESGAMTLSSTPGSSASALRSACRPLAWMPSSLVSRTRTRSILGAGRGASFRDNPAMSEENVEFVRRAYERLAQNDPLGDWTWFFDEFAHEDLELRPAGMYLDAAHSYRGREGWAQFWRDFSSVWEEWRFDPEAFEFLDAGDKVVVFARAVGRGKGSGIEIAQDEAHLWTLRDGRVAVGTSYPDREDALRDAGLAE